MDKMDTPETYDANPVYAPAPKPVQAKKPA